MKMSGYDSSRCRSHFFSLMKKIFAIFAFVGLLGCERPSDSVAVAKKDGTIALDVNGVQFYRKDLEREIDFREALVRICRPQVDATNARVRIEKGITNSLIQVMLFKTAADARGIQASDAITNAVLEQYQKTFLRGSKVKSLAELEKGLSDRGLIDVYTNNLARDVAQKAYFEVVHGKDLIFEEKDVDNFMQRIKDYNAMVAATNALAYAKATNLWMRIKAGADFAALADKESEDPDREKGGALGECEKVDFDHDPGYWEKVSRLKKGEVSDVITTDVGIEIVKALSSLAPSENTGDPALQLARIYIRRAMSHPNWTREETRVEMENEYREDAIRMTYEEITSNAVVRVNGKEVPVSKKKKAPETEKTSESDSRNNKEKDE